jgi:hypothetical protein
MEMKPFWSCRETSRLVAEDDFACLPFGTKLALRLHLAYCRHCRRFRRQIRLLAVAARLRMKDIALGDVAAFEARLLARLKA